MLDRFLKQTGVTSETSAMQEAVKSALQQRKNKVYSRDEVGNERGPFRSELHSLMRAAAKRYSHPVSDAEHFEAIGRIAQTLSARYGSILKGGRFRYGTAQKAFNLYLKFLWRLRQTSTPPHCPVDGQVLAAAGIEGRWTHSDSQAEYADWIRILRQRANPLSLSEWEYRLWSPQAAISEKRKGCC